MKTIIGIVGGQESGKDTAADYLCQKLGGRKIAIADKLKLFVGRMYGLSPEHFSDRTLKETVVPRLGQTPRQLLQATGDTFAELFYKSFLVCVALEEVYHRLLGLHEHYAVISDVRFQHEADKILSWGEEGGMRVLFIKLNYAWTVPETSHRSEKGWAKIPTDVSITPSSVAELHRELDAFVQPFLQD